MTCNKQLVIEAFMKDPLINGRLTEKECGDLVSEMIALTSTYLPQGWKE